MELLPLFERAETILFHAVSFKIVMLIEIRKITTEYVMFWLIFVLQLKDFRRMSQILIQSRCWYFTKIFLYIHILYALSNSYFSLSSLSLSLYLEKESEKSNPIERILDNQKIPGDNLRLDSFTIHASLLALNHEQHSGDPRADSTSANRFAFVRNFIFLARSMRVD